MMFELILLLLLLLALFVFLLLIGCMVWSTIQGSDSFVVSLLAFSRTIQVRKKVGFTIKL